MPPREGSVLARRIRYANPPLRLPLVAVALWVIGSVGLLRGARPFGVLAAGSASCLIVASALAARRVSRWRAASRSLAEEFGTWTDLVTALGGSTHRATWRGSVIEERDHVFLGVLDRSEVPILVHVKSLQRNVMVCGPPASGKARRFMIPAASQVLRRRDSSVVVLGLKGSRGLFNATRSSAEALGLPFKYLTVAPNRASHLWNPLQDASFRELPQGMKAELLLRSLGFANGAGYFPAVHERVLRAVLERRPDVRSMREIVDILRAHAARPTSYSDEHTSWALSVLLNAFARCTALEQLVGTAVDGLPDSVHRAAINLDEAFEQSCVLFFDLPEYNEALTAHFVARLVSRLLFLSALRRARASRPSRRVYALLDNCDSIADDSLADLLQISAPAGVSFWLSLRDPATIPPDLASHCGLDVVFGGDHSWLRDYYVAAGGGRPPWAAHPWLPGGPVDEDRVRDALHRVSRGPDIAFVHLKDTREEGYCPLRRPAVVRTSFPRYSEGHERLDTTPWPDTGPETLCTVVSSAGLAIPRTDLTA